MSAQGTLFAFSALKAAFDVTVMVRPGRNRRLILRDRRPDKVHRLTEFAATFTFAGVVVEQRMKLAAAYSRMESCH